MDIVLIGTGNTATVLGRKVNQAGHRIVQVVGRRVGPTEALAEELDAAWTTGLESTISGAQLYLVAVADAAIADVASRLPLQQETIAHTAASVSLQVLSNVSVNYGVFYPLQTLTKTVSRLPVVPVMIDASNDKTRGLLQELALSISDKVTFAGDELRLKTHLAAVMANNFTNHLFALVEDYCKKEGLEFTFFLPLVTETVARLAEVSPAAAQTGPARRHDAGTINKHLSLLENHPHLRQLYTLFTSSIQQAVKGAP